MRRVPNMCQLFRLPYLLPQRPTLSRPIPTRGVAIPSVSWPIVNKKPAYSFDKPTTSWRQTFWRLFICILRKIFFLNFGRKNLSKNFGEKLEKLPTGKKIWRKNLGKTFLGKKFGQQISEKKFGKNMKSFQAECLKDN